MAKANQAVIAENAKKLVNMIIEKKDQVEIDKFVSLYFAKVEDTKKLLRLATYVANATKRHKSTKTFRTQLNVKVWLGVLHGFLDIKEPVTNKTKSNTKPKGKSELAKSLFG